MAENTDDVAPAENTEATSKNVPVRRERIVTRSPVPIMDTAAFDHIGRIANVMAESGMMPESLRCIIEGRGNNRVVTDLPSKVIIARAFMIAELASRINMSPFAIMGCASFVHGKLMLEGKVASAAIENQLGVRLSYEWGKWNPKTETCDCSNGPGEGDNLAIIASAVLPGETIPREAHGYVGGWKTTGDGTPWRPGAMRRQMIYRSNREFERLHASGTLLGVISEGDGEYIDGEYTVMEPAALPAPTLDDALGSQKGRTARAAKPASPASPAPDQAHDPKTGEVIEKTEPKPTPAEQAAAADHAEKTRLAAQTDAELRKTPPAKVAQPTITVEEGEPLPGEVYHVVDDLGFDPADGMWQTFKNGKPHARSPGKDGNRVYASHGSLISAQDGAAAPNTPADPAHAADADASASETANAQEQTSSADPGYDVAGMNAYSADVRAQTSWDVVEQIIARFRKSSTFTKAPETIRDMALGMTYDHAATLLDPLAIRAEPAFYRLWMLKAPPAEVMPAFRILARSPKYEKMSEAERQELLAETLQASGG